MVVPPHSMYHTISAFLLGSLTLSGIIQLVETHEESYGTLLAIPLLVLCAMPVSSSRPARIQLLEGILAHVLELVVICMSIVFARSQGTKSSGDTTTFGKSSGDTTDVLCMVVIVIMIPSTPILSLSNASDPDKRWHTIYKAVIYTTWYIGILVATVWGGNTRPSGDGEVLLQWVIPLTMASSLSMINIFQQFSTRGGKQYMDKMTVCMITVFFGVLMSRQGSTPWILRLTAVLIISSCRIFLMVCSLPWVADDTTTTQPLLADHTKPSRDSLFHGVRIEASHTHNRPIK